MYHPPKSRNDFIDFLRGALIFLVIIGHLIQFMGYGDDPGLFYHDPLFRLIYIFHMPLFMLVSGFVSQPSIDKSNLRDCIRRRFQQVIMPALCWPVLGLLAGVAACLVFYRKPEDGRQVAVILLKSFKPGLWFLWAVFASTATVACLKKIKQAHVLGFIITTLLLLLAPDGANIYLFKFTFPFFWVGYLLAKGDGIAVTAKVSPGVLVVIFTASIGCYLFWKTDTYIYVSKMKPGGGNWFNILFRWFAGAVASAAFTWVMFKAYRVFPSKTLSRWGRHSIDIYILQDFFIEDLSGIQTFLRHSLWFSFVGAPALAAIIAFFSCETGALISRSPVAGRFLFGRIKIPISRLANSHPEK